MWQQKVRKSKRKILEIESDILYLLLSFAFPCSPLLSLAYFFYLRPSEDIFSASWIAILTVSETALKMVEII